MVTGEVCLDFGTEVGRKRMGFMESSGVLRVFRGRMI